uniref:Expressed protein n=1 Tax=Oryza sativa subsp. japonica TaxID=39947 RepID=Q109G6_ORYSJ|nr:expressed protein [Oryza sativa Japonica Group]
MSFLYGLLLPIRACTLEITDILISRRHIGQNHIKMMTQTTVESTPKRILHFSPHLYICQPLWCILLSNLLKLYILDLINQKKYIYTPKHHADPLSVSSASFLFPLSPPSFSLSPEPSRHPRVLFLHRDHRRSPSPSQPRR